MYTVCAAQVRGKLDGMYNISQKTAKIKTNSKGRVCHRKRLTQKDETSKIKRMPEKEGMQFIRHETLQEANQG